MTVSEADRLRNAVSGRLEPVGRNRTFITWMTIPTMALVAACMISAADQNQYFFNALPAEARPLATTIEIAWLVVTCLLMAWRYRCRTPEDVSFKTIMKAALLLGFLAWLCPHPNSADMFMYVADGRLMVLHHLSPYYHVYHDVVDRWPWAWVQTRMVYGPANIPLFAAAGWMSNWDVPQAWSGSPWVQEHPVVQQWIAASNVLLPLYFIKTVNLILHVASTGLLWRALPAHPMYRQRLLLYAVNPFYLFEAIANGHQDELVVFGMCLALAALREGYQILALAAALLATLTKITGAVLLGGLFIHLLENRRWPAVAVGILLMVAAVAGIKMALFNNYSDMKVLAPWLRMNDRSYLPNGCISAMLLPDPANPVWKVDLLGLWWFAVRPATVLLCGIMLVRARRFLDLMQGQLIIWAAVLTIITTYLRAWYFLCLLPLGLFLPAGFFEYTLLQSFAIPFCAYFGWEWAVLFGYGAVAFALLWWTESELRAPRRRLAVSLAMSEAVLGFLTLAGFQQDLAYCIGLHFIPFVWLLGALWQRERRRCVL